MFWALFKKFFPQWSIKCFFQTHCLSFYCKKPLKELILNRINFPYNGFIRFFFYSKLTEQVSVWQCLFSHLTFDVLKPATSVYFVSFFHLKIRQVFTLTLKTHYYVFLFYLVNLFRYLASDIHQTCYVSFGISVPYRTIFSHESRTECSFLFI